MTSVIKGKIAVGSTSMQACSCSTRGILAMCACACDSNYLMVCVSAVLCQGYLGRCWRQPTRTGLAVQPRAGSFYLGICRLMLAAALLYGCWLCGPKFYQGRIGRCDRAVPHGHHLGNQSRVGSAQHKVCAVSQRSLSTLLQSVGQSTT